MRGAVGMTLAVVIEQSAKQAIIDVSQEEGSRMLFIAGGVIALTLIINATGAQSILYSLGLIDDNSEEIRVMQHYVR